MNFSSKLHFSVGYSITEWKQYMRAGNTREHHSVSLFSVPVSGRTVNFFAITGRGRVWSHLSVVILCPTHHPWGHSFSWKRRRTGSGSDTFLFLYSRESGWQVKQWGDSSPTVGSACFSFIVFLVLGLGRACGCGWFVHHCFFFSQHGHRHFHLPFSSLSQEMHDSGCGAVALSQTQWVFLLLIAIFYTLLLLVLLLLVFVFLRMLMPFVSTFLFQAIISTFITLSLERKETSCLESNFQLVSNHDIQKKWYIVEKLLKFSVFRVRGFLQAEGVV